MNIEHCSACGRPFTFIERKLKGPGTRERESIDCPHCFHQLRTESIDGYFTTHKLSEGQKAAAGATGAG